MHSVDFDVCAWIAAAFYIGIVLRENAFRAHLYLIANPRYVDRSFFFSFTRSHKFCEGMRSARLNLLEQFSQAIVAVSSTIWSSLKCCRTRANNSSETSRPVIVMASAYSSASRSFSSKSELVLYSARARI